MKKKVNYFSTSKILTTSTQILTILHYLKPIIKIHHLLYALVLSVMQNLVLVFKKKHVNFNTKVLGANTVNISLHVNFI